MGAFYGSTFVKTDSATSIRQILNQLAQNDHIRFYLSPPISGWVAVYNENHGQEPIGNRLAEHLKEDILSVMVHDDDIFCYWLYRNGSLVDQYCSAPDYFGEELADESGLGWEGSPDEFEPMLKNPDKLNRLEEILYPDGIEDENANTDSDQDDPSIFKPTLDMQKILKMKQMSESVKYFLDNPEEIIEFCLSHDIPLKDKLQDKLVPMIREGKTPQQIQDALLADPAIIHDVVLSAMNKFAEETSDQIDSQQAIAEFEKQVTEQIEQSNSYVFASQQLEDFANLLGLPNALTSYEYLAGGETEDIENWDQFEQIG